jgi:hypothetical protein
MSGGCTPSCVTTGVGDGPENIGGQDIQPPQLESFGCADVPGEILLYVDVNGDDETGDGSEAAPLATITQALDMASDGSTILVKPGLYVGRIRMRGTFAQGVTVRSDQQYRAQLRNDDTVLTFYADSRGCEGITLQGFDIAHSGPGSGALVLHVDGGGTGGVSRITLRDNVMHDSFNNDILKVNNSAQDIVVERNLFYNQTGSDEHIDINSVINVTVQDNVFFNDFAGSGRANQNDTSSFIVVKDSNADEDIYVGSSNVTVRRNVFLNWEGSTGSNFLLLGEDGQTFFEVDAVLVENNLFVGNSSNVMRSAFGVKGGRNVLFRNNTIVGDLPSLAFAMRLNREGSNRPNESIRFFNNIWSDPTGTMGARSTEDGSDFSDTAGEDISSFELQSNLYWNGGNALPEDANELINPSGDSAAVVSDPLLGDQSNISLPRWDESAGVFADGSATICEAFDRLVETVGTPADGSAAIDAARPEQAAEDDILGAARDDTPDIGALERR